MHESTTAIMSSRVLVDQIETESINYSYLPLIPIDYLIEVVVRHYINALNLKNLDYACCLVDGALNDMIGICSSCINGTIDDIYDDLYHGTYAIIEVGHRIIPHILPQIRSIAMEYDTDYIHVISDTDSSRLTTLRIEYSV